MLKETVELALNSYLKEIAKLGLIDRVLLGIDQEKGVARFFNVFNREIVIGKDQIDPQLTQFGTVLERALAPEVTARVSYVLPSRVDRLRDDCIQRGIELSEISLKS